MDYRITGLSPEPFRHLFGLPDDALAAHGAIRYIADAAPGFPDRIELRDAQPGERVKAVARRVGFGSAAAFTRAYTRAFGHAPTTMREARS